MSFQIFSEYSSYCYSYLYEDNPQNYVGLVGADLSGPNNGYVSKNNLIYMQYRKNVIHYGTKFPNAKIGDILYYSSVNGENLEDGVPVGVCAIMGCNMPDGMTRFISLTPTDRTNDAFSNLTNNTSYQMGYDRLKYYKVLPVISPATKTFPDNNINDMKDYSEITKIINDASICINAGNDPEYLDKRNPIIVVPALVQTKDASVYDHYLMKALKQRTDFIRLKNNSPNADIDYTAYHSRWGTVGLAPNWIKDECTTIMPTPYQDSDSSLNIQAIHSYSAPLTSSPLSDFNGYENTKAFIDYDMQYSSFGGTGIYEYENSKLLYRDTHLIPVFAWNYHLTLKTMYNSKDNVYEPNYYKPGDWYLPSCGELNLVMARWATILIAITNIGKSMGRDWHLADSSVYPTSTAWDKNYVWAFDTNTCAFKTIERIPSSSSAQDGKYAVFPMRKL